MIGHKNKQTQILNLLYFKCIDFSLQQNQTFAQKCANLLIRIPQTIVLNSAFQRENEFC